MKDNESIDTSKVENGDSNLFPTPGVANKEEVIQGHNVSDGDDTEEGPSQWSREIE